MTQRRPDDPANTITRTELLTDGQARALAGLLDIDLPSSSVLPPLWHWVYLPERARQVELGVDGHPAGGIPAPPAAGMRRMFAGGRVRMREPLRFMTQATRTTRLCRSVRRQGRQGMLTFATVNHQWSQDGGLVITEEQDIVYLPGSAEPARATAAPARTAVAVHSDGGTDAPANPSVDGRTGRPADARTELTPNAPGSDAAGPRLRFSIDPTVLFRFSALTYNAHRIHYDTGYAAEQGYPDLVIHGPLQALLMAELLRRSGHDLFGRTFSYRLVAPAFGAQTLTVTADGSPGRAWVRDEMGRTTASATLTDLGSTAESTEATESAVAE